MTKFPESENRNPLLFKGRWIDGEDSKIAEIMTAWDMPRRKWFHKWLKYDLDGNEICFFEFDNQRTNGLFFINKALPALDKNKASDIHSNFNVVCNPIIDRYISVHPDWQPGWENPIFSEGSFAEQFGSGQDNPRRNSIFQDYHNVFDGHPYFYIEYTNLCDLNNMIKVADPGDPLLLNCYAISDELEDWYLKQRPHHCARTMGELLRLIIDWDLAYHHFGNREEVAILSHKILGTIDMPIEIYEAIIEQIPPSIVVRYIKNDPDLFNFGERPKTPQIVSDWLREKYWSMRQHIYDEFLNVSEMDENHYCHRNLI